MPRPWTVSEDQSLRVLYPQLEVSMQKIRNTLHRGTHDIHGRAETLHLARPKRTLGTNPGRNVEHNAKSLAEVRAFAQLDWAITLLRRLGYCPVHAERRSDTSIEETGRWVVGRRILSRDEFVALAQKRRQL